MTFSLSHRILLLALFGMATIPSMKLWAESAPSTVTPGAATQDPGTGSPVVSTPPAAAPATAEPLSLVIDRMIAASSRTLRRSPLLSPAMPNSSAASIWT